MNISSRIRKIVYPIMIRSFFSKKFKTLTKTNFPWSWFSHKWIVFDRYIFKVFELWTFCIITGIVYYSIQFNYLLISYFLTRSGNRFSPWKSSMANKEKFEPYAFKKYGWAWFDVQLTVTSCWSNDHVKVSCWIISLVHVCSCRKSQGEWAIKLLCMRSCYQLR